MATGKPNLFVWKAVVVGLGVAIFAVATIIVVELIRRSVSDDLPPPSPVEAPAPAAPSAPLLSLDPDRPVVARIGLPEGANVVDTYPMGGTLAVDLRLANGTRRVMLIDPSTGQALGTFDLVAGAAETTP